MRLGKVFKNPQIPEDTCELLAQLAKGWNIRRSIVIGDQTGEICHAVHWDKDCATFAMNVGTEFSQNGARIIGRSGADPETDENPVDVGYSLDRQDLDSVVVDGDMPQLPAIIESWQQHVRPGGSLIIVDKDDKGDFSHILDSDAYEYRQVEGTGIHAFVKRHATDRV